MLPSKATLLAFVGLVLLLAASAVTNVLVFRINADLKESVASLERQKVGLTDALTASERNAADARKRADDLKPIYREIDRAPDAPVPAAIERALDGLRDLQRGNRSQVPPDVR